MKKHKIITYLNFFRFSFLLILLALISGCGTQEAKNKMSLLFSQNAEKGAITKENDGTYILTMTDISDTTIAFADRPIRKAFLLETGSFFTVFPEMFSEAPPNAVLHFKPEKGGKEIDLAVLILRDPEYQADSKTVTYIIEDIPLKGEVEGITNEGGFLQSLAGEFWEPSLFIDPAQLNTDHFFEQDIEGVTNATVCLIGNPKEGYQFCVSGTPGCCE